MEPLKPPLALEEIMCDFMSGKSLWEGNATELLETLEKSYTALPVDATRLSKALTNIASLLEYQGVAIERIKRGHERIICITTLPHYISAQSSRGRKK